MTTWKFSQSREIKAVHSQKLQTHPQDPFLRCSIKILFSKNWKLCLLVLQLVPWKLRIYICCGPNAHPRPAIGAGWKGNWVHSHHPSTLVWQLWLLISSHSPPLTQPPISLVPPKVFFLLIGNFSSHYCLLPCQALASTVSFWIINYPSIIHKLQTFCKDRNSWMTFPSLSFWQNWGSVLHLAYLKRKKWVFLLLYWPKKISKAFSWPTSSSKARLHHIWRKKHTKSSK